MLAVAVLLPLAMDGAFGGDRGPVHRRIGVALTAFFAAIVAIALVGSMARPTSWYLKRWPDEAALAISRATKDAGTKAVWPSDRHSDWLLWRLPELRGRVAYDVRFELVDDAGIRSILRYKALRRAGTTSCAATGGRRRPGRHAKAPKGAAADRRASAVFDDDVVVVQLPVTRP